MRKPNIETKLDIDSPDKAEWKLPDKKTVSRQGIVKDMEDDFDFIREKLLNTINKGEFLLDKAIEMAEIEIHPRVVEAASAILKSVCDSSQQLFDLHQRMIASKEKMGTLKDEVDKNASSTAQTKANEPVKVKATLQDVVDAAKKASMPMIAKDDTNDDDVDDSPIVEDDTDDSDIDDSLIIDDDDPISDTLDDESFEDIFEQPHK